MLRIFNLTRNVGSNLSRSTIRGEQQKSRLIPPNQFLLWFNEVPGKFSSVPRALATRGFLSLEEGAGGDTDTAGLACDTLLRYGAGHLTSTNITRYFVKSQYSRQNTRTPAQELLSLSSSTSSCQSVQYWPVTS